MKEHLKRLLHSPALLSSAVIILLLLFFNGYSDIRFHERYREGQIKIACVGDSITYGYGIKNQPFRSYPDMLDSMLTDNYNVRNFGNIRVTVQPDGDQPFIETYTYSDSVEFDADIIIFMLGTNDAKTVNWKGEEKFTNDYLSLLGTYLESEKTPEIYLCTPATAYFSGKGEHKSSIYDIQPDTVEIIADCVRNIASEQGYRLIDINAVTKNQRELFSYDGVHPEKSGAEVIANEVHKALVQAR